MNFEKIKLVVNPKAGQSKMRRKILDIVEEIFKRSGKYYQIEFTQNKGDATRIAQEALECGYELIVAVGGDGTINEVATALIFTPGLLGIIPTGSGNGLARELAIPLNITKASELIGKARGKVKELDAGRVNQQYFFATLGVGFDAYIAKLFNDYGPEGRGLSRYFYLTLKAFFQYQPPPISLRLQEQEIRCTPFLLTIANIKQFGGGAIIAPQANPYDGILDICLINKLSIWQFLYHWPKLFTGTIDKLSSLIMTFRTPSLEIHMPSNTPYHLDGESFSELNTLSVTILPKALRVYVHKSGL
jgi:YegS/Rv2252/BmrU family lipid kinase